AGGAELAELAHELEQLGGHTEALKEVQAEVAGVTEATDVADASKENSPRHV
ncbi:HPt (histidine-containing phosphotransfer) domain-containing protein, partial [Arthrobacter sp. GAS37]